MERLVALGTVLAFVSVYHTSADKVGTVVVDDGRVGIGLITGGSFGPGSFSIGAPGKGRPTQMSVYANEDNGDGILHNGGEQDNTRPPQRGTASEPNKSGGGNRGNAQQNPAKPLKEHIYKGQGGQGGTGGGQILIGTVILPNNKNNKGNKKKNANKKPSSAGASALEAIFASNGANNGSPSAEHGSNYDYGSSIQIDSITGGHFGPGAMSLNYNRRPVPNVPKKGSAVNNGNNEYPHAGNEALYTIGHGTNKDGNTGDEYNHGQINSGYIAESNEKPWIWSN